MSPHLPDTTALEKPRSVELGRGITIGFALLLLIIEGCLTVFQSIQRTPAETVPLLVRFGLTILLMWGVYVGSRVARWIAVVLVGLGGLVALLFALLQISSDPIMALVLASLGVIDLSFAFFLSWPSPVSRYVEWRYASRAAQRAARRAAA